MEFNEKLRNLRKQKGITQEELAEKLFVSRTAVSKWESGKGYPSIDSLKMISKFYSVTVDELLSGEEMLALAEEENLDLVKISPNAVPPVCKIMNYGKFKFEQAKREKENRKNQQVVEVKEIYLSMTIDVGDLNVKAKKTLEFLADGAKVKVSIRMRGRQMAHSAMGVDVMRRFFEMLGGKAVMDKAPTTEGRNILMMLSPAK